MPIRVRNMLRAAQQDLWSLGVSQDTFHNEVAPAQHETAPIFARINVSADQNALTMDILREHAQRHGTGARAAAREAMLTTVRCCRLRDSLSREALQGHQRQRQTLQLQYRCGRPERLQAGCVPLARMAWLPMAWLPLG